MRKAQKILLGFIALSAFLVLIRDRNTPDSAPLFPTGDVAETGWINVVYADESNLEDYTEHTFFTTDDGAIYEIANAVQAVHHSHNGKYVELYGTFVDADPTRNDDLPMIQVERVQMLEAYDTHPIVQGNERWVNVACRFSDMDNTPQPISYFEDMMLNKEPGMDDYWRITSAGLVNIEGSASYGWYDLPQNKNYYERAATSNVGFALKLLLTHCAQAAATQDKVDFAQFSGINIMLNDTFGCCAWGGSMALNVDGKLVNFRTTWLPPWAFNSLHVIAHEMGHGWGLPHSSGPYGKVYDSAWDVMSGGSRLIASCPVTNTQFGCHQVGTIGYHLDMLGWLPESRVATVASGNTVEVHLSALTRITTSQGMLLVKIPMGNTNNFYTVEVRNYVGYDRNLPGEAVVLHTVVPTRSSPAHVVDGDNNGDPNDEGAMWLAGETFTDSTYGIEVSVLRREGGDFVVQIRNK